MQNQPNLLIATLIFGLIEGLCSGQVPSDTPSFQHGIYLIGAPTDDNTGGCRISVISPEGGKAETIFRRDSGYIYPGGRFSRLGDRLAFCYVGSDGAGRILLIGAAGKITSSFGAKGMITAWSNDDRKLAFYGDDENHLLASFVIDVSSGELTKLELPADYVADDWHPREATRTLMYMNPRNRLYRPTKGDHYPTRQIDLMASTGQRTPITKNPSTDNIWSRFSPNGGHIAHYGRRLAGEKSLEYVVVCNADGTEHRERLSFTEYGERVGLRWFRPNGPPAWSPDSSMLAWAVSTNTEPRSGGERLELVLLQVAGGEPRRVSLSDQGIEWLAGLEWR